MAFPCGMAREAGEKNVVRGDIGRLDLGDVPCRLVTEVLLVSTNRESIDPTWRDPTVGLRVCADAN